MLLSVFIFGTNFWFQSELYDRFQKFRIQSFTSYVIKRYVELENDIRKVPDGEYRDWETDRKSTRLNSSHITRSRMPSSA